MKHFIVQRAAVQALVCWRMSIPEDGTRSQLTSEPASMELVDDDERHYTPHHSECKDCHGRDNQPYSVCDVLFEFDKI